MLRRAGVIVSFLVLMSVGGTFSQTSAKIEGRGDQARRTELAVLEGKRPPSLSIARWYNSPPLKFYSYGVSGKVVLIDFWGLWCPGCKESIPYVKALHEKYSKQGLVIIGVHTPRDADKLETFIKDNGIKHAIAVDASPDGRNGKTGDDYLIKVVPSFYFIDRKGNLRYADVAYGSVETAIVELLAEK